MNHDDLMEAFGPKAASTYDQQWSRLSSFREALHLLMSAALTDAGEHARVLCVGAGTGSEILYLAERFPGWHFTAVDPSEAMLDVCRQHVQARGIAERCAFHAGYLSSLPAGEPFDVATSLLVSQFITARDERIAYFADIARRLQPNGRLVSSDLSWDTSAASYPQMLATWFGVMSAGGITPEGVARMRTAYEKHVAILPQAEVGAIIAAAGFETPVLFAQFGLIHAWQAKRTRG
jgi:tRNA (cmo5U34)-methyltransferase